MSRAILFDKDGTLIDFQSYADALIATIDDLPRWLATHLCSGANARA
ncbi:MAG: hypothetical protein QOI88_2866 [Gammaproteobacteria bacterium]|nr:hypothetical protein [Gammaproteobacteria bacterium]